MAAAVARSVLAVAALFPALAGCGEAPTFDPVTDRPGGGAPPWRLTYGAGDDRAPAWSADGDSVYYTAASFVGANRSPGVLAAVPRSGGPGRLLLGTLQAAATEPAWLLAPRPSPTGDRLAFVELSSLRGAGTCTGTVTCTEDPLAVTVPQLRRYRLHVRAAAAAGSLNGDVVHEVEFPGFAIDTDSPPPGIQGVEIVRRHPVHVLYETESALPFRPSWSPDGRRLAFTDGLSLHVWHVDSGQATPVPGTADALWPAWSPAGDRIAYTTVARLDSLAVTCRGFVLGLLACQQERVDYVLGERTIVVVSPDGGERTVLGPGEEPAWSPDGATLYFRRDDAIWRRPAAGGPAEPVPGTAGGREPAVSPDGAYLAFARGQDPGRDVWVVAVP